jgi:hypothetical protein
MKNLTNNNNRRRTNTLALALRCHGRRAFNEIELHLFQLDSRCLVEDFKVLYVFFKPDDALTQFFLADTFSSFDKKKIELVPDSYLKYNGLLFIIGPQSDRVSFSFFQLS